MTPVDQLLQAHRQFLAFVEKRVESREAAEDILQEAFVRALRAGSGIEKEERVTAWFYRVLRNAIVDHYRKRAAAERLAEGASREPLPDSEPHEEVCACLVPLLDSLKPEYRDALRLIDMDEAPLSDLAARAGITPGNAAVRVHRARKALLARIKEACGVCAEHGCRDCRCAAAQCHGS